MRIQFNTGRQYTENGQRIIVDYNWCEQRIVFRDIDRRIDGEISASNANITAHELQEIVMFNYDRGCYLSTFKASELDLKWEE